MNLEKLYHKGNAVFIHSNGDVKKVAAYKVKPYELKERKEESKEEKREEHDWKKIIEEDERSKGEEVNEEEKDEQEVESEEKENEQEVENEGFKISENGESVCFFGKFNLCGRSSS